MVDTTTPETPANSGATELRARIVTHRDGLLKQVAELTAQLAGLSQGTRRERRAASAKTRARSRKAARKALLAQRAAELQARMDRVKP